MRSLRLAITMFTVIPLPAEPASRSLAGRALLWLPVVGLLLGAAGGLIAWLAGSAFLGAALVVTLWTVATGGLHLDGLADTADGLASRKPAPEALAIMKRSDIGPFGVIAIVLVLLLNVAAITSLLTGDGSLPAGTTSMDAGGGGLSTANGLSTLSGLSTANGLSTLSGGLSILIVAPMAGRVAAVLASGYPSARPGGFGDLVAGALGHRARFATALAALLAGTAVAYLMGGLTSAIITATSMIISVGVSISLLRAVVRWLGGTTGDIFGALIEATTTLTLLASALIG